MNSFYTLSSSFRSQSTWFYSFAALFNYGWRLCRNCSLDLLLVGSIFGSLSRPSKDNDAWCWDLLALKVALISTYLSTDLYCKLLTVGLSPSVSRFFVGSLTLTISGRYYTEGTEDSIELSTLFLLSRFESLLVKDSTDWFWLNSEFIPRRCRLETNHWWVTGFVRRWGALRLFSSFLSMKLCVSCPIDFSES